MSYYILQSLIGPGTAAVAPPTSSLDALLTSKEKTSHSRSELHFHVTLIRFTVTPLIRIIENPGSNRKRSVTTHRSWWWNVVNCDRRKRLFVLLFKWRFNWELIIFISDGLYWLRSPLYVQLDFLPHSYIGEIVLLIIPLTGFVSTY